MPDERKERRDDVVKIGGGQPKPAPGSPGFSREPVSPREGPKRPAPSRITK